MQEIASTSVLFIIPGLRYGGAERVLVTLLKHLDRSKFRLALAVVDTRGAAFLDHLPDDVELIDLDCNRVRYALPKIISLIWKRRPDVVFSTLGHLNLALAIVRPLLPSKVRYIARETSIVTYTLQTYVWPLAWATLYQRFYKRSDLLVCQSNYMQSDLVEHFGYPKQRAVVINNPVEVDVIQSLSSIPLNHSGTPVGKIWLVAAGRMTEEKGFDLLIEAVALLADSRVHVSLLGDGPLLDALKGLAVAKGVAGQVDFVGYQSNPYAWFARADAFVLPSRYEGFPNVVLEALTCGTPVIATPAPGGVREILDDLSECRVAAGVSPEALARAMSDWIAGSQKRVPGTAIEPYRIERIVGQYEGLLLSTGTTV